MMTLSEALDHLFAWNHIKYCVETGTNEGLGTTKMLFDASEKTGQATEIHTIECNPVFFNKATTNIMKYDCVDYGRVSNYLGLSIPKELLPDRKKIASHLIELQNLPEFIYFDHIVEDRITNYLAETDFNISEDQLRRVLGALPSVDLFLLDSAGHIGFIEFKYLMWLLEYEFNHKIGPRVLFVLDDIKHCKHYESWDYIKHSKKFEVQVESDHRFGFGIAAYYKDNV